MDSPVIQLRFKGRLVQTLSFEGDVLRIGRMRENDIVISNASVSRFHAVLKREEGRVILEDSGSENGCYVNGTRVVGTRPARTRRRDPGGKAPAAARRSGC